MKTIVLIAALLAGCVGTSEVVKTGPDTYLVIGHSDSGLHSGQGPIVAAKRANEFCASQGREAKIIDRQTRGIPGLTQMDTDVTFECIAKGGK